MFSESQNFAIVQTELDSVFFQNFDYDATFPGIATANTVALFRVVNTDHAAYIEEIYKGSGLFPKIGETTTVPTTTPRVANKLTTYISDFANSIEISKNLFDDDMQSVWSKTVADFAIKARITQDDNAFALFRNAFTTTLTADGAAFISSHTLLNGQTQTNLATGALTEATLYNAQVMLRQQKDEAGVIMGNVGTILLVPSKLFKQAIQITESALISGSGNNDINVYRSAYGITVYSSPYLDAVAGGSDTAWFLLARNHAVTRLVRQGIQTALRDWSMSNNRTYLYQANFRETVYVANYIAAVGSLGQ
jgi:hypothetical protein